MPGFRLRENRTGPTPDRRLGIKLADPSAEKRLGGKLHAYVPPELQYDYKPPSVFARYKVVTAIFVALLLGLLGLWASVLRRPPPPSPARPAASHAVPAPKPQDQPIYVEPLPAK